MSFLDKAKSKATQLTHQAKEKFEDIKETRKVDELLDDLGRITFRQHTGRGLDGDTAEIAVLVRKLQDMEAEGADVLPKPAVEDAPATSTTTSAADAPTDAPPPFEPPAI
jgi:hypothetical protein